MPTPWQTRPVEWGLLWSLGRWLSPLTPEDLAPPGVERSAVRVAPRRPADRPFEAWIYRPLDRPIQGALLVCPGLHYAGPADPRLDRFLRVLAGSGLLVLSPFLPDFTALEVKESLTDDLERALGALLEHPARPRSITPGIFSISFGSLPSLRLAARATPERPLGGLLVFGGYADFSRTLAHCLGQGAEGPRDPLNQPVVFLNLLPWLEVPEPERLAAALRRFVESTWGRPELKAKARHQPIAEAVGAELTGRTAQVYRIATGLDDGAFALAETALRARGTDAHLDPRPVLAQIRCPVHLVHGRDDDVIPHTELDALAAAFPAGAAVSTYKTGLYAHTGRGGFGNLADGFRELVTMFGMLKAIVEVSTAAGSP
ncbi:MAG: hypothetical protein IPG45_11375 [Deltaproteobacteria bacterium]|nr:hypothetical protein [Deltaproteobacteria bacterium]